MRYYFYHDSCQSWTSSACFLLLFVLCSFLNGQNLTTALLVVTQGILFQNFFPTLVNMLVVTITLVYETIQFNRMVLSKIMNHLGNLRNSAGFLLMSPVILPWEYVLNYGAQEFRMMYRYPPCTRHCKVLGQRVGFNGERISFGAESCNSFKSSGSSQQMNIISEIVSVIKLTSLLPLSWASLAISIPVYCIRENKSLNVTFG